MERTNLLQILSIGGVMVNPEHPGYRTAFAPHHERRWRSRSDEDLVYPLTWWRGRDGIDDHAVREWFPTLSDHA